MNETESKRCYLVRTSADLVANSKVGIGWSNIDFSQLGSVDELIKVIDETYGIGRRANQLRRFLSISEGDFIVASLPYSIAIGRATGAIFHDESYRPADRANQRRVTFPCDEKGEVATLPRTAFSEAFQRRLRVRGMTVNDLDEFREEIVDAYTKISTGEDFSWSSRIAERIEEAESDFKRTLLENIQSGRTNLQTGGIGLEHLVKELLAIDGYNSSVLSRRAFPEFADADVKASRSDFCSTVNLLVQVKHHSGFSNENGLAQLEQIKNLGLAEYEDHQLVFCTSAAVSPEFQSRAETQGILVIDGTELVEWISQNMEHLSKTTKASLGICEVPSVFASS